MRPLCFSPGGAAEYSLGRQPQDMQTRNECFLSPNGAARLRVVAPVGLQDNPAGFAVPGGLT
jgi:hypothetical protein